MKKYVKPTSTNPTRMAGETSNLIPALMAGVASVATGFSAAQIGAGLATGVGAAVGGKAARKLMRSNYPERINRPDTKVLITE